MRDIDVTFDGTAGPLAGRLRRPVGAPRAWAVLAHCFTCGKDLIGLRNLGRALAEAGIGVLRFDFTGIGESGGEFAETTLMSNVADIRAAAAWLEAHEAAPALLVGHSLGGAAALLAAGDLPAVCAVATIGAPFDPGHTLALLEPARAAIERDGVGEIVLAGRRVRIGRALWEDLASRDLGERIGALRRALLVLHAPLDAVVPVEQARALFEAARHPKSFVSLDDADHLLSVPRDAAWVGRLIACWADPYLPEVPADDEPPQEGVVEVVTGARGFRTEIRAGTHRLVADEPVAVGGEDAGPAPYDWLLGALGACTGMTLRMYADRKGLDLREVRVRLTHDHVHAADTGSAGKIALIEREIVLEGDLDDAARARLLEIAERCPVHRTLEGEIRIRTRSS